MKYLEIEHKYELTHNEFLEFMARYAYVDNTKFFQGTDYFFPLSNKNFIRYREDSLNHTRKELTIKCKKNRNIIVRDEVNLLLDSTASIEDLKQFFKLLSVKKELGKIEKAGFYRDELTVTLSCYSATFPNHKEKFFLEFETLSDSNTSEKQLQKEINRYKKILRFINFSKRKRINKSLYEMMLENINE